MGHSPMIAQLIVALCFGLASFAAPAHDLKTADQVVVHKGERQLYLMRDGEDLSPAELVRRIGAALGHQTALFPVPASLLKLGAGCVGRAAEARRLLGSLIVDDRSIRQELEWNPPFTVDEGLAETAAWFRATLP